MPDNAKVKPDSERISQEADLELLRGALKANLAALAALSRVEVYTLPVIEAVPRLADGWHVADISPPDEDKTNWSCMAVPNYIGKPSDKIYGFGDTPRAAVLEAQTKIKVRIEKDAKEAEKFQAKRAVWAAEEAAAMAARKAKGRNSTT